MKFNTLKFGCLFLASILLVSVAISAFAEYPDGAYVVDLVNEGDHLNVHGTPSIYDVVDHLDEGTVVMYQYSDKGWWHVQWWKGNENFGEGYIDPAYVTAIDANVSAKYTCVDNLYVHSQAKIAWGQCDNYHIGQLKAGETFSVLEQDGNWSRINYKGGTGWVASIYLVRVG